MHWTQTFRFDEFDSDSGSTLKVRVWARVQFREFEFGFIIIVRLKLMVQGCVIHLTRCCKRSDILISCKKIVVRCTCIYVGVLNRPDTPTFICLYNLNPSWEKCEFFTSCTSYIVLLICNYFGSMLLLGTRTDKYVLWIIISNVL